MEDFENDSIEFINEIYVVVLAPSKNTGKCQMDNFRGESTLTSWLKSACLFYCYNKYQRKVKMPIVGQLPNPNDEKYDEDREELLKNAPSSNGEAYSLPGMME